ncbi:MAG TPA: hypothetical protein VEW08_03235, partial [Steroidobacteraceae bacterium]|nr:hypothetical protein [Steroidobacteraceae bacterium]
IDSATALHLTIAIFMAANYASCPRHATAGAAVCDLRRRRTPSARKIPRRAAVEASSRGFTLVLRRMAIGPSTGQL